MVSSLYHWWSVSQSVSEITIGRVTTDLQSQFKWSWSWWSSVTVFAGYFIFLVYIYECCLLPPSWKVSSGLAGFSRVPLQLTFQVNIGHLMALIPDWGIQTSGQRTYFCIKCSLVFEFSILVIIYYYINIDNSVKVKR